MNIVPALGRFRQCSYENLSREKISLYNISGDEIYSGEIVLVHFFPGKKEDLITLLIRDLPLPEQVSESELA